MANRIADCHAPSAEDLRRVFETAVCSVPADRQVKSPQYRSPIFQRGGAPDTEKRALSDAARALTQLWKISAHLAR